MSLKYTKSENLLERARKVTPLGAQTYSKSFRYFCEGNSPSFIEKGEGCRVWDVDGNEFIDFICALGPVTVGYNNKQINEAIVNQLNKGISFSQSTEVEVELAEKLTQIIPCAEMVRFVKNGSDATTAAIRLARAYTGRDMVALCGYHGMHDWSIGSTANNRGVPKPICDLTKTFNYNDINSLNILFDEYKDKIAAVILEPIQANGPEEGYLQAIREIASKNGAVLIFDEVVSGFRYALGGAAELYNVTPDMVAIGKGMGNGMPISVVAGKRDIMELIEQGVFVSTTFGGETLSIVAALETIKILEKPNVYEGIWKLGNMMLKGLNTIIDNKKVSDVVFTSGLAPHAGIQFEGKGRLDYLDINSIFQQRMIQEGIMSVGINNLNLSHSEKEIELYLNAAELALSDIQRAIEKDSVLEILKGGKVNPVFKRNIK